MTLDLLRAVYRAVAESVDSLEYDEVGLDLVYVLGAMLSDSRCELPEDRAIVHILRDKFPTSHEVWQYVKVEGLDA